MYFYKYEGAGNDFIITEDIEEKDVVFNKIFMPIKYGEERESYCIYGFGNGKNVMIYEQYYKKSLEIVSVFPVLYNLIETIGLEKNSYGYGKSY